VPAPIGFAPIGVNKNYHPEGEIAVAKVAGELGLPYALSTAGSSSIEDVGRANGKGPRFYQLVSAAEICRGSQVGADGNSTCHTMTSLRLAC
jgi:isopentenyl diphosphate isomerase/L-lactate dehydrogenase-like FMN-dependent dehydrogenase